MDFPIIELPDPDECEAWLEKHFHPEGQRCPHCQASREESHFFRVNQGSRLCVYRCQRCEGIYNLYSNTVFAESQLTPVHVVLLLRGVSQGKPSNQLAREIGLTEKTVLKWRHRLQAQAESLQPETPLVDKETESDEMFQNTGEKGREHFDPADPPRRRANKRRGRGTFANDRLPILGTIGRQSGQARLQVAKDTTGQTLRAHVHQFTQPGPHVYTDEYDSYNGIRRTRSTVTHSTHEWARDKDGDGICEVHTNTVEGMWTGLRNFLPPFRGMSKHFLSDYVAIHEFCVNLKVISRQFVAHLVRLHSFYC